MARPVKRPSMDELQTQVHALACAMTQEWLDLQAELIRKSQELLDIKGVPILDGVRETIRSSLPELQSKYETNGTVGFKTLGVKAQTINQDSIDPK